MCKAVVTCLLEPGDSVRVGGDAALGHRRGGHGLLLRVRQRGEETSLGQDLHSIREFRDSPVSIEDGVLSPLAFIS